LKLLFKSVLLNSKLPSGPLAGLYVRYYHTGLLEIARLRTGIRA